MAILLDQARLYLQLQGHLPEMFLLTEVLGRNEKEAQQVMEWREREMLVFHPAVLAIKLVAERKRLREELGLPAVADEEAKLFEDETQITTVSTKATFTPEGIELEDKNIPQDIQERIKQELREQLESQNTHFGVAEFKGMDGPGSVLLPDGRTMHFDSLAEFIQAVREGKLRQEGEENGEDE